MGLKFRMVWGFRDIIYIYIHRIQRILFRGFGFRERGCHLAFRV